MNDQTQQTNDNLERATRQLDTIEQLITLLMDDIDLSELKMSERLNIAIKLMTQHARTLKLRDDISEEHDPSKDQVFFANLRRQLRGGPSDQDFDDPLSSEEDIHPFSPEVEF
jgi:hypothetical protein